MKLFKTNNIDNVRNCEKNLRLSCQVYYLHIGVSILVKYKHCDAFCKLLAF